MINVSAKWPPKRIRPTPADYLLSPQKRKQITEAIHGKSIVLEDVEIPIVFRKNGEEQHAEKGELFLAQITGNPDRLLLGHIHVPGGGGETTDMVIPANDNTILSLDGCVVSGNDIYSTFWPLFIRGDNEECRLRYGIDMGTLQLFLDVCKANHVAEISVLRGRREISKHEKIEREHYKLILGKDGRKPMFFSQKGVATDSGGVMYKTICAMESSNAICTEDIGVHIHTSLLVAEDKQEPMLVSVRWQPEEINNDLCSSLGPPLTLQIAEFARHLYKHGDRATCRSCGKPFQLGSFGKSSAVLAAAACVRDRICPQCCDYKVYDRLRNELYEKIKSVITEDDWEETLVTFEHHAPNWESYIERSHKA